MADFTTLKSRQIAHLVARFDTRADLCKCCDCTMDELMIWQTMASEKTGRRAGELPRRTLAKLMARARAYGVLLTDADFSPRYFQPNEKD